MGRDSDVTRPEYNREFRGLGPLPSDVTLDGQPFAGQKDPAVWLLPGDGWGRFDAEVGARWVKKRTELWIYTREAREVSLHLQVVSDAQPVQLRVTEVENRNAVSEELGTEGVEYVLLSAGWNKLDLRLSPGPQSGNASSPDGWFVTGLEIRTD